MNKKLLNYTPYFLLIYSNGELFFKFYAIEKGISKGITYNTIINYPKYHYDKDMYKVSKDLIFDYIATDKIFNFIFKNKVFIKNIKVLYYWGRYKERFENK